MQKKDNETNWFDGNIEVGVDYLTHVYFDFKDNKVNTLFHGGIDHPIDGIRLGSAKSGGEVLSFEEFFEKYPEFLEKINKND